MKFQLLSMNYFRQLEGMEPTLVDDPFKEPPEVRGPISDIFKQKKIFFQ